jgi:hypothetical protein
MNILNKLNKEYQIEIKNNIAYDLQDNNNIIATSKQELIEFYIDSFKYKIECLFDDEIEIKHHYVDIIKQLEALN